jgi:alkylhydroperoxidase/carboxymuconolactone decarboxylase family protein YurZ
MTLPDPYVNLQTRQPELVEAYERLGAAATEGGPLEAREVRLVKLALAVGAGLEGAVHSHARRALEAGISGDALRHAVLQSTTTLGFPAMMRSMTWLEDVLDRE